MKKKEIIALLTLTISLTTTACNFQFKTKNQVPNKPTIISEEIASEIAGILENTNFTDDEELESLVEEINNWADDLVKENENLSEFQKAKLVRVVDGDTIVVDIEGDEYKVRLIGVNTPESVHPDSSKNTEEGIASSEYTKNLLSNVQEVYLQKDISETDRYGRFLRYVWLEIPEDENNINEIATKMLNGILLLDHVAEVATYEPDTSHKDDFEWIYDNM